MLSVKEAIKKTFKKYEDKNGRIKLIRSSEIDFDLSFNIEDEIEFLLTSLGLEHKVELIETYRDSFGTYYVLCVSYIEHEVLITYNVPVWA